MSNITLIHKKIEINVNQSSSSGVKVKQCCSNEMFCNVSWSVLTIKIWVELRGGDSWYTKSTENMSWRWLKWFLTQKCALNRSLWEGVQHYTNKDVSWLYIEVTTQWFPLPLNNFPTIVKYCTLDLCNDFWGVNFINILLD